LRDQPRDNPRYWTGRSDGSVEIKDSLSEMFPGLGVLQIQVRDLVIKDKDPRLEEAKSRVCSKIRDSIGSPDQVKDQRILRAYRDFYWRVGIDPTKTRPAGEALVRRIVSGRGLPQINTFVDAYNIASAESFIAIAAFDLARVDPDGLVMRRARAGEEFLGIGMEKPIVLSGVEVVVEDRGRLIALYPYRDSDESKVTMDTKGALLMMCGVPGLGEADLQLASSLAKRYVEEFCTKRGSSGASGP